MRTLLATAVASALLVALACSTGGPDNSACAGRTAPQCLSGGPCSCSDVISSNGTPLCISAAWVCPAGYTRYEDCKGVPPGPECRDAGLDASKDGRADATGD